MREVVATLPGIPGKRNSLLKSVVVLTIPVLASISSADKAGRQKEVLGKSRGSLIITFS
jgi:hypothetical protein